MTKKEKRDFSRCGARANEEKKCKRMNLKFNQIVLTYDVSLERTKTIKAYFGGFEELYEGIPVIKLLTSKSKKECTLIPMIHIRSMRVPLTKAKEIVNHQGGMYV